MARSQAPSQRPADPNTYPRSRPFAAGLARAARALLALGVSLGLLAGTAWGASVMSKDPDLATRLGYRSVQERRAAAPALIQMSVLAEAVLVPAPHDLILASQTSSGALRLKPSDERVIPYFANLACLGLVRERPQEVRAYLEWYLGHLNRPDRAGLVGTVYDHEVDGAGEERSTGRYDSADAYAATFLTLVREYVEATGDLDFVRERLGDLTLVASVIRVLQDQDGLIWATAARREKYLMDNCECFRGLVDWAAVLETLGHDQEAADIRAAAGQVRQAVITRLWNPKLGNFDWGIYTLWLPGGRRVEITRPSSWRRWYPDAVAQLFPVVSGLLKPQDKRAKALYESFNAWHPGWVVHDKDDPHPWAIVGYAAALMGDRERAGAFARSLADGYFGSEGPFACLSWELSLYLLTVERLGPGAP
ncbi:MAG: hypothetical protein K6U08_02260 [Firmicutes bacterium]|nr:hypothetical protein [Bacillota bacterium]